MTSILKRVKFSGSDFGKKAGKAMESMEVKQTNWEELGISNEEKSGMEA